MKYMVEKTMNKRDPTIMYKKAITKTSSLVQLLLPSTYKMTEAYALTLLECSTAKANETLDQ